jgi:hypothetical protein
VSPKESLKLSLKNPVGNLEINREPPPLTNHYNDHEWGRGDPSGAAYIVITPCDQGEYKTLSIYLTTIIYMCVGLKEL